MNISPAVSAPQSIPELPIDLWGAIMVRSDARSWARAQATSQLLREAGQLPEVSIAHVTRREGGALTVREALQKSPQERQALVMRRARLDECLPRREVWMDLVLKPWADGQVLGVIHDTFLRLHRPIGAPRPVLEAVSLAEGGVGMDCRPLSALSDHALPWPGRNSPPRRRGCLKYFRPENGLFWISFEDLVSGAGPRGGVGAQRVDSDDDFVGCDVSEDLSMGAWIAADGHITMGDAGGLWQCAWQPGRPGLRAPLAVSFVSNPVQLVVQAHDLSLSGWSVGDDTPSRLWGPITLTLPTVPVTSENATIAGLMPLGDRGFLAQSWANLPDAQDVLVSSVFVQYDILGRLPSRLTPITQTPEEDVSPLAVEEGGGRLLVSVKSDPAPFYALRLFDLSAQDQPHLPSTYVTFGREDESFPPVQLALHRGAQLAAAAWDEPVGRVGLWRLGAPGARPELIWQFRPTLCLARALLFSDDGGSLRLLSRGAGAIVLTYGPPPDGAEARDTALCLPADPEAPKVLCAAPNFEGVI